ncbi:MAG TPA: MTH1187 family thiamine-binding protein, partial [Thermodesulfobacteriota bacterium]|nr:MTH1187 family thiamine-binding protein [Thermodesulfobacteriota bacterium]
PATGRGFPEMRYHLIVSFSPLCRRACRTLTGQIFEWRETMAILEISVVPIGTSDTSLSAYVADCLRILKKEKIRYELSSMGTNIEGDLKDLFRIAYRMHLTPFKKGALRVVTTLKIDDRRDKKGTLKGKKSAVQSKLRLGK